ncbi:MAG: MFS transporter, partial [Hyphomicrobiaceae bacterium]
MTAPSDPLIDSAYAWRRLIVSLLIATVSGVGFWSTVVVLPAIEVEFGITRADASLPYTATLIGFAIGGVAYGWVVDRIGIAIPVAIGGVMLGLGYIATAFAENTWQFVIAQGVLIGMLGSAVGFGPLVADVSLWFKRRRGIAIALVASGNYIAGAVWPPIIQHLTSAYDWRVAHMVMGVVCVVVMVGLAPLLRRRPPSITLAPGVTAPAEQLVPMPVSKTALQALLVIAGISCCIAMSMPQVHIVAYCVDLGFGPARGAEMLSIMLGLGVVSRIASGLLADRIGGLMTLIIGSMLQAIALSFYLPFDGLASLYLVSALFGLAQGGIVPSYALVVREYYPAREAASRVSFVLMSTVGGMALGGWLS